MGWVLGRDLSERAASCDSLYQAVVRITTLKVNKLTDEMNRAVQNGVESKCGVDFREGDVKAEQDFEDKA